MLFTAFPVFDAFGTTFKRKSYRQKEKKKLREESSLFRKKLRKDCADLLRRNFSSILTLLLPAHHIFYIFSRMCCFPISNPFGAFFLILRVTT